MVNTSLSRFAMPIEFGQSFGGGVDNATPEDTQRSLDDFFLRQKYEKIAEGFGYKTPQLARSLASVSGNIDGNITGMSPVAGSNDVLWNITTDSGKNYTMTTYNPYAPHEGGWGISNKNIDPAFQQGSGPWGQVNALIGETSAIKNMPEVEARIQESSWIDIVAPLLIGGLAFAGAGGLLGAAEAGAAGAVGASTPVGAMSVPGTYGGMSSTAALTNAGSTGTMLGGFGGSAMGTGLTLAGVDALGPGLSALGTSGIPGIDYEVPQSDLDALMDSPAGGGGTTADWWKQAISPFSKYSVTDLIRTAIPAEWLPSGTGSDRLLERSLGLLGQGQQQPTGGLLGGGGGYSRGNSPYAANPVTYQKAQYAKIFGE